MRFSLLLAILGGASCLSAAVLPPDSVQTANGVVQGVMDAATGIRAFKGIPFAAPPVGGLRWKEPQPVKNWKGVRQAARFGPRAMQRPIYGDMRFRSDGVSEDCLYLNVWTPAKPGGKGLPVLVYFFGGGFLAGDGSELRYDGESMAKLGIVSVTVNYRLNVFGFLAHPELTRESPHHASGNYGLLDQHAALEWVRRNISSFGGDPRKVTIAGESAGSISVSAQMASPLSKKLFARAIGESGSLMGAFTPVPLSKAEENGVKFAESLGARSLAELRAMSAEKILAATAGRGGSRTSLAVEGWFLPKDPVSIFAAGEQAHVPLLVGWNSEEANRLAVLGRDAPTAENLGKAIHRLYGDNGDALAKVYAPGPEEDAAQVATDLAGDRFIAYSTWKWFDLQRWTGGKPVYRYYFARPRPAESGGAGGNQAHGAVHSAEIEYALGNLPGNKVYDWTPDDYKVSAAMQQYFANFVKTGNPNGPGLPEWPAASAAQPVEVMRIDVQCLAAPEKHPDRYQTLDQLIGVH